MSKLTAAFLSVVLLSGLALPLSSQARFADPAPSGEPVLHLGEVTVTGQKQIMQALQAIKAALKRPESSDASQRNVVVCRIDKDIGTHSQDILNCATNETISHRRQDIANGMIGGCETVMSGGTNCTVTMAFSDRSPLGEALNRSQDHVMRIPVNGAALKGLLARLPDPAPADSTAPQPDSVAPASAKDATPAPAAGTSSGHGLRSKSQP